ncbi:MAG: hypothetical protein ABIH88_00485 [Patescibacteria group bacterium]|nr:hypothetical protein [Patescibacteria group bacterium]
MKEQEPTNIFHNDGKEASGALGKYAALLDYYCIGEEVREKVWPQIINNLNVNLQETIQQIEGWWEEAFGSNDNEATAAQKESKRQTDLAQLPKIERMKYEGRRKNNNR